MKTRIILTFGLVLGFLILGCTKKSEKTNSMPVGESGGIEAKAFLLEDSNKKPVQLSDFRGEKFLLHFWATWCAPCIEEIPAIISFSLKHDVRLVAISLDSSWEEAHKTLTPTLVKGKIVSLLDSEMKISEAYGSFQFPETYLISADQKIITKWIGPQNWNDPAFVKLIKN